MKIFVRLKDEWNDKVPMSIRELAYMLFGVGVLYAGLAYLPQSLAGVIISGALLWGMLSISGAIGDILRYVSERKKLDSRYGIPLRPSVAV